MTLAIFIFAKHKKEKNLYSILKTSQKMEVAKSRVGLYPNKDTLKATLKIIPEMLMEVIL